MKRVIFIIIIFSTLFYNFYLLLYYFDLKASMEKDIKTKSDKAAETIQYLIKENLEKNYIIDDLFYKAVFSDFKNNSYDNASFLQINRHLKKISGNLDLDISKYLPKLKEIFTQRLSVIEIENKKEFILLAGYKNGYVTIVKYLIPKEISSPLSIDDFKKNVMENGDIKYIYISDTPFNENTARSTSSLYPVYKSIKVNDTVNDENKTYYIKIIVDISSYEKALNKNILDIIFGIIVTFLIVILLVLHNYLNEKYIKTLDYLKNKEKDILLGSVAAGVAHEIRNPLNSINYSIEYLKSFIKEEKAMRYFDIIINEIRRIDMGLKDFLDIRKEIKLNKEKLSVSSIIKNIIDLMSQEYKVNSIDFKLDLEHDFYIMADLVRIKEAFINILKNSKEAVAESNKKIILVKLIHNAVLFSDSGTGMSSDEISKLFNLYFTTKEDGNGIGLYRTKKIIEAHNGEIIVSSQKSYGTDIKIIFKEVVK